MTGMVGGKKKIAKHLAKVMLEYLEDLDLDPNKLIFLETFAGMASVSCQLSQHFSQTILSDENGDLIKLWKAIQTGWKPPDNITKEQYTRLKNSKRSSVLRTFAGFGYSFGNKFFSGYQPWGKRSKKSILKAKQCLKRTTFFHCDYSAWNPKGLVIYLDPPYKNSAQKYFHSEKEQPFDHDKFWNIARKWSKNNIVFISEENAPDDFVSIWSKNVTLRIGSKRLTKEQLFVFKG